MLHRIARTALWIGLSALVASPAFAGDDKTSGSLTAWTVTEGDLKVGTESLRVVNKDGAIYASGERKYKRGKSKGHWKTHQQRSADGETLKYRKQNAGRAGSGVFGFKKGGVLRVVGLNQKTMKASEYSVLGHLIWDGPSWHQLDLWARRAAGDAATIKYFDIKARKSGEATLKKGASIDVADKDATNVTLTVWTLSGTPDTLDLLLDGKKRLAGVRGEGRKMLRKGWSWEAGPPVADDDDDDDDDDAASAKPQDPDAEEKDEDDDDDGPVDPGP